MKSCSVSKGANGVCRIGVRECAQQQRKARAICFRSQSRPEVLFAKRLDS